jgi:hypothetical protein
MIEFKTHPKEQNERHKIRLAYLAEQEQWSIIMPRHHQGAAMERRKVLVA